MRSALRIRTSLIRVVTRAVVAGALILGAAPVLAQAADGAVAPATPLAEPLTEFVPAETPVLETPPAELAPPVEESPPAEEPVAVTPPVEEPVEVAPPTVPPVTETPPVTEVPVTEAPPAPPTPPVVETPPPTPPVTEAQTPPTQPQPTPVAPPATEAAPTGGTAIPGPATPTEIGTPVVDENAAIPLPALEAAPPPPAADAGTATAKIGDTVKRVDTIKTAAPTELISATSVPPLTSTTTPTTSGRDGATDTPSGATSQAAKRASGGVEMLNAPTQTNASVPPAESSPATTPARAASFARSQIAGDGFRLATPLKPDLRDPSARPPTETVSLPRPPATDETSTTATKDDVFAARVEAPMSAVAGGSSLLAVLASYALPGTGPVPMSLALVMFAQLAIMLGMMRAPRVHLSEQLVIVGLLAGDAGHSRAVQRPG